MPGFCINKLFILHVKYIADFWVELGYFNMSIMSKNRDLSRESRSFGYEKHENTKKNDFFLNFGLPQSKIPRPNLGRNFGGNFFQKKIFFCRRFSVK